MQDICRVNYGINAGYMQVICRVYTGYVGGICRVYRGYMRDISPASTSPSSSASICRANARSHPLPLTTCASASV